MTSLDRNTLAAITAWVALCSSGGCAALVGADFDDKTLGEGGGATASGAGPGSGATSSSGASTTSSTTSVTGPGPTSTSTGDGGAPASTSTGDGGAASTSTGDGGATVTNSAGNAGGGGASVTNGVGSGGGGAGGAGGGTCEPNAWAQMEGIPSADDGFGKVAVAPCGEVVLSTNIDVGPNVFVRKLTSAGDEDWTFDPDLAGRQDVRAVAFDPDGDVIVAGMSNADMVLGAPCGTVPISSAGDDVFVLKLDGRNGQCIWAHGFGADGADEEPVAVAVHPSNGEIFVAGSFEATMNFGGAQLIATGSSTFLVSYESDGTPMWGRGFTGGHPDDLASNGDLVFMAGSFGGPLTIDGDVIGTAPAGFEHAFSAAFDPSNGDEVWGEGFGTGSSDVRLNAAAVDGTTSVVFVGSMDGAASFGANSVNSQARDLVILEQDASTGDPIWSEVVVTAGDQRARGVAISPGGEVYVSGVFDESLVFGTLGALPANSGDDDIFIVRYSAVRAPEWSKSFVVAETGVAANARYTPMGFASSTDDVVTLFTASSVQVLTESLTRLDEEAVVVKLHGVDGSL